jgi:hypothetical protein
VSSTWLPRLWALVLAVLMLGPALGWGYVLSYDMVWVPHLALRPELLGLGSAVPRDVPSDAVVAVLDNVTPAMLLQKVVLLGSLLGAAEGVIRLVAPVTTSVGPRMAAVSLCVWNPFVAERLAIGHWPVLVGYAVLPWLVLAGRRFRDSGAMPAELWILLPLGSLSASAGLVSALAIVTTAWPRRAGRRILRQYAALAAAIVAANAPWVVTGLLHAGAATGVMRTDLFGLHAEGSVPAPLAMLSLGGIWNSEVVPGTRTGLLGWTALAVFAAIAVLGARTWWRRAGADEARRLIVLGILGYGTALLTWIWPGSVDWLGAHVPGGGLLRDGARTLALCMPMWVGLMAAAVENVVVTMSARPARVAAVVAGCLLPVMVLPDASWGIGQRLSPSSYPESWATARDVVEPGHGDVLVLPFSGYRAPRWNHGHTVADPLGRFLKPGFLVNDELFVSGHRVPGEDPRAVAASRALRAPDPHSRAARLRALGVGYVAVERDARPRDQPEIAGQVVVDRPDLEVVRLSPAPSAHPCSMGDRVLAGAAWLAFAASIVLGICLLVRQRRRPDGRWSRSVGSSRGRGRRQG